jgi:hypothetical protein
VAFIEGDNPVEPFPEPERDLVKAGDFPFAFGRTQRGIGDKKDAFGETDVAPLALSDVSAYGTDLMFS